MFAINSGIQRPLEVTIQRSDASIKSSSERDTNAFGLTYLQVFGLQVLAGHQVGELQVEVDANGSSHHLNGSARRGTFKGNDRSSHSRIPIVNRNLPGK